MEKKIPKEFHGGRCLNAIMHNDKLNGYQKIILIRITSICDLGVDATFREWKYHTKEQLVKTIGHNIGTIRKHLKILIADGYLLERTSHKISGRIGGNEYCITSKIFDEYLQKLVDIDPMVSKDLDPNIEGFDNPTLSNLGGFDNPTLSNLGGLTLSNLGGLTLSNLIPIYNPFFHNQINKNDFLEYTAHTRAYDPTQIPEEENIVEKIESPKNLFLKSVEILNRVISMADRTYKPSGEVKFITSVDASKRKCMIQSLAEDFHHRAILQLEYEHKNTRKGRELDCNEEEIRRHLSAYLKELIEEGIIIVDKK